MEFRLLGPVEVIGDDGVPLALGGRRPRALLALLLLHANEAVSTDRLINGVWGESAPANALGALQVHVHALRKALGSDRIVTRAPGYLVRVDSEELDLERFTQLVERRDRDALREALALWRGPALADIADEQFARAEAIRLDEGRLGDLEGAVAAARESAEISERAGDREAHAYALAHVASYDLQRGDRERAAGTVVDALRVASEGGGLWATAIGLLYAAQITLSFGSEREAALLLGSAHATFDGVGEGRWEIERDDWAPTRDELGRRLGADLERLLEEGRALPPDEAVGLALAVLPASAGSAAAPS